MKFTIGTRKNNDETTDYSVVVEVASTDNTHKNLDIVEVYTQSKHGSFARVNAERLCERLNQLWENK